MAIEEPIDSTENSSSVENNTRSQSPRRGFLRGLGVAGALGVTSLAGCVGGDDDSGDEDIVKIGLTRSQTGDFVFDSEKGYRGFKLWQEAVNDDGGLEIDGEQKEVELVEYDDRSERQRTVRLYENLVEDDNVDVLLAPFSSTLTSASAAVANRSDTLMMAWSAADPGIYEQGYENLVSSEVPSDRLMEGQLPVMEETGVESIGVLYLENAFTTSLAETIQDDAPDHGIEVVHFESFSDETLDYSSTLRSIADKSPDAIFLGSFVNDIIDMMTQMREEDITFPWIQSWYSQNSEFYEALGESSNYAFGAHNIHPEMERDVDIGMDVTEFISTYRDRWDGNDPQFGSTNAYCAGVALGEMIEMAGTANDTEALKQAAVDLNGNTLTYGPWDMEPDQGFQVSSLGQYITVQNQSVEGDSQYDRFEVIGPESHVTPTADPVYPFPGWD